MSITENNNIRLAGFKFYRTDSNAVPQWVSLSGNIGSWYEYEVIDVTLLAIDSDLTDVVNYNLISGTLPGTCTLNSSTGQITGNPAVVNEDTTYTFTIGATDGKTTINRQFNILIRNNIAPVWITPTGSLGTTYEMDAINYQVLASDSTGPQALVYSLVSGSLPTGSTLNVNTGAITGPAVAVGVNTTFTFTINVTDGIESIDREFSIGVTNNTQPVWQTAAGSLGNYNFGDTISHLLIAVDSDGLPQPVTYSIVAGSLPDGCIMDTSGNITGTAPDISITTSYIFTVRATDSVDYSDRQFSIGVIGNAYLINNSLMLNGVDEYLTRTPTVQGNRKTWTFSCWFKICKIKDQVLFSTIGDGTNTGYLLLNSSGTITLRASNAGDRTSTVLLRDASAWYNLVWVYDSANTSQRAWLNGIEITSTFSPSLTPSLNADSAFNINSYHRIGRHYDPYSYYFDGYLSETYFIDGAALTPNAFGEFDLNSGEWKPKAYTGTYGTNGFYINYEDASNLGADSSGTIAPQKISQSTGSIVTNASANTSACFNDSGEASGSSSYVTSQNLYVGKDYTIPRAVCGFRCWGSSDRGYQGDNTSHTMTLILLGSNTNDPTTANVVYTAPSFTNTNSTNPKDYSNAVSNPPSYRYWWLQVRDENWSSGYTTILSELEFYELGANNFTPLNITTSNQTIDTPTNNFATAFGLANTYGGTYNPVIPTNGALSFSLPPYGYVTGTHYIPSDLDVYFEVYVSSIGTDNSYIGVYDATKMPIYGLSVQYRANGTVYVGTTPNSTGYSYTSGDYVGVYVSNKTSTIKFYKNTTLVYTATLPSNSNWMFQVNNANATGTCSYSVNFGQNTFQYPANTGTAKTLCTTNLPTPSIKDGDKHFDVVTYTGNGSTQTITGLDFQPDFLWFKKRSNISQHALLNVVTGWDRDLATDSTNVESVYGIAPVTPTINGFTLNGSYSNFNDPGDSYVAWCWKAGGTAVTNNDGTITSQVSANPTAGFSIVTYTGTGTTATIGHGLNTIPKFIIVKSRSVAGHDWPVYHVSLGNSSILYLDLTNSATSGTNWNNTTPTSSIFSVFDNPDTNGNGTQHVAYCWSEIEGFSKFGSYTGNGSTDGPFIYCGFKPRYILVKNSISVTDWSVWDTVRDTYNAAQYKLSPNTNAVEGANNFIDITSAGFKLRDTHVNYNAGGGNYIFAAFADTPINYSTAR